MRHQKFIVVDMHNVYVYGTVAIIAVIGIVALLLNEGMEAGKNANYYHRQLEIKKCELEKYKSAYNDLVQSGTCLQRIYDDRTL